MLATSLKINMQPMPLFLNDKVYVIAGATASGVYSNKVFAADLNASVEASTTCTARMAMPLRVRPSCRRKYADGSVTASKIASNTITTSDLANRFSNTSSLRLHSTTGSDSLCGYQCFFSVTAEGKYLLTNGKRMVVIDG